MSFKFFMNIAVYFVVVIVVIVAGNIDENTIKCPLVWETVSFGEALPSDAVRVATYEEAHYVARANNSGVFSGGRYTEGLVYVVSENQVITHQSNYGILTNPHKCVVDWVDKSYNGPNKVVVDTNSYIGRVVVDGKLLSGEITSQKLYVVNLSFNKEEKTDFQVMRSFSKGLTLSMTNFNFLDEDPFPPVKDFVGMDEIINNGDSNLVQTVKFTKRTLERSVFFSAKSQQHTISVGVSVKAEVAGVTPEAELGFDIPWGSSNSQEFSKEIENTIEITREVIVPPFTAVQVCSTINLADNFNATYEAKGVYMAPGLTPEEIKTVMALDGKIGFVDPQNNVYHSESGRFSGSMTLTNQFIIVPYDSPEGCAQLAQKISTARKALQKAKFDKTLTKIYNKDIEDMIIRMTKPQSSKNVNWPLNIL